VTALVYGHICPTHGDYLPEGVKWVGLGADRHVVYLYKLKPGNTRRTKILIGEVRRSRRPGARGERCWRAFPVRVSEFPEVFDDHRLALQYLVDRWEAGPLLVEPAKPYRPTPPRKYPDPPSEPAPWPKFFGDDPFGSES
jgi:hypothetical protein